VPGGKLANQTFVNVIGGFQDSYITLKRWGYIVQGYVNTKTHRDITDEMWFVAE